MQKKSSHRDSFLIRSCESQNKPSKMIKLYQAKNTSKEDSNKKTCAAQLRINKDVNELELPPGCDIEFMGKTRTCSIV